MTRFLRSATVVAVLGAALLRPAPAAAQGALALAGQWTLNRSLSQIPREVGFVTDGLVAPTSSAALPTRPESADDAQRVRVLLGEVRNPPARMTIAETDAAVIVTSGDGQARTFRPTGREDVLYLSGVSVGTTTRREANRLTVAYNLEEGRVLRYAYEHIASLSQLVVDVELVGRGGGDKVKLVYQPASAAEMAAAAAATAAVPAAGNAPFNQQPDAELKGLTKLGLVVEDLSPQAAACGLTQAALEAAATTHLTDAGFTVVRNSDEDTYVYVHIVTTNPSSSLCVSSYDVFFYSHVTAKLSYQQAPVLLQVSLLNKGGLAGGPPATHGATVLRGVQDYIDQFSARIRDANK